MTRPQTIGSRTAPARGIAADQMRRHNLSLVLERLHREGPRSRSQLTASTGLNRSTIADLIGELAGLGLVEERPGVAASGPGRPSSRVETRPDGAVVLAVELSVDSVAVATVGLGGHVFGTVRVARHRSRLSPEKSVQDIEQLGRPLLAVLPDEHALAGVGVAVVGMVRQRDGLVRLAPNLGWNDVPLAAMLADRFGVDRRVWIANDADLGALAEHRRMWPHVSHLVWVNGEVGIGVGVIADGKPLRGAGGYAGEAGHTLVNPAGRACRCGSVGCWETEAGEGALLRLSGLDRRGSGFAWLEELETRIRNGHEPTLRAIDEVGRWLGLGIANLVNVFNPELVVLGGLYHRLFDHLQPGVTAAAGRALPAPAGDVSIVPSRIGPDAVLIGAAELVLTEVIADPARHRLTAAAR